MSRFGWLLLLSLFGCETSSLTEVVVTVSAEEQVQRRATQTTLVLTRDPGRSSSVVLHDDRDAPHVVGFAQRPYVIAISPSAGNERSVYELEVAALERGRPIARARLISSYVEGQTRYVNITLEDTCIDVSCGEQLTCRTGACVDARVDAEKFSVTSDDAPRNTDLVDESNVMTTRPKPDAGARDARTDTPPESDPSTDDPAPTDPGGTTPVTPNTPVMTVPDAAVPVLPSDAGPPKLPSDAGPPKLPSDAGVSDGGKSFLCRPMGTWIARREELPGGTCGSNINDFPVEYSGSISDPMAKEANCQFMPTLSADGCIMNYVHDCLVVTPTETFIERETGRIEMTFSNFMIGQATVVLLDPITYADKGCKSMVVLSASKK